MFISILLLWSPANPALYRAYTTVKTVSGVVDDYSSTFGIRTLSWSPSNGFSLNGARFAIEGVCEHQSIAWVQNAVPDSRWPVEFAMIKDAGYNAVRCSHYPRDPSFYDAADSMGLLLLVEVPSWGYGKGGYSPAFWTRLENCAREMVLRGYNHPSIFLWGLFNEPYADYSAGLARVQAVVKALDSARATIAAFNGMVGGEKIPDVIGLNYNTIRQLGDPLSASHNFVTTEYFEG
jgi:beta-galactosidase